MMTIEDFLSNYAYILLCLLCLHTGQKARVPVNPVVRVQKVAPPPTPKLTWPNGESLEGQLSEASAESLSWKSPLFEDQLVLRWEAIHRIDQPLPSLPSSEPFLIVLKDGGNIRGDIIAITDQAISIRSARNGDVALSRSQVLSARRIKGGNLLAAGPAGDAGWAVTTNDPNMAAERQNTRPAPNIPQLESGAFGALRLPYWNRSASYAINLPQRLDLEFRVHSSIRPDFRISLNAGAKQGLILETWDEDLVVSTGDHFKAICKLTPEQREVALRVCWDAATRHCSIFSPAGEPLAEWDAPDEAMPLPKGIALQNKERDLTLDFFRLCAWDGKAPPRVDSRLPRVEMADARVLPGAITSGSAATSFTFQLSGTAAPQNFPLADVDAIIFSTDPTPLAPSAETLDFSDGSFLNGRIRSIKAGVAALDTSFTAEPFSTKLDGLRHMRITSGSAPAQVPPATLDTLHIRGVTIHGNLVNAGDASPRWLAPGAVTPSLPAKLLPFEITRAFPPHTPITACPSLLYTAAGDVLPGTLRGMDQSVVEFDSTVASFKSLPASALDAIQFTASANAPISSFDDPAWRLLKGDANTVKRSNGTLTMDPETAIGSARVMQSSEIHFSIATDNFSTVRLRMFCDGTDPAKSVNLLLARIGQLLYTGLETTSGQLDPRADTRVRPGKIPIRLVLLDSSIDLFVNGMLAQSLPIPPASRAGAGLIIEPAGVFGNGATKIVLADFSADSSPGHAPVPDINQETKSQTLTVPRFRRDDPPKHAILGPNGDLLRGEIEAATASDFAFRSGLETFTIPRDRVTAAIWLKKPPEGAAPPPAQKTAMQALLDRKLLRPKFISGATSGFLMLSLKHDFPELKFNVPQPDDSKPVTFRVTPSMTVQDELDLICRLYSLRYFIDYAGDPATIGTIVFQRLSQAPSGLLTKLYWLKPNALPAAASARELLAAKGIPFPSGASAEWQPRGAQLTMTNSPEAHTKLEALLASDFGGSLGSPTHWLLLANGARFPLAVQSFGPDLITGTHPIYGRFEVPTRDVYIIRNSPPAPSPSMNALRDWQLVYAPEPIIPDAGGETSPALGKDAKPFKLPLLATGEFDLSTQRGKITVLDFWATWCGPCVRSLPGLIASMQQFPPDKVQLIGINQGEPPAQVKQFLETRGWKLTVAMDTTQTVGRLYGIDSIPQTIIVGSDGKVAWVKTGYTPDGENEIAAAITKLLPHPK